MVRPRWRGTIEVLGPLRVRSGGELGLRPAGRRVLAILLLDPAGALSRDTLLDHVWGDHAPPTAATALQVHLSGIRKAAPGLIVTAGHRYRVDLSAWRLDRTAFEALAERAVREMRAGDWEGAVRSATRALTIWRGTPYEELRDDDVAIGEIGRLTSIHDDLVDLRTRGLLAMGRREEGIGELRRVVRLHPLREPLWETLMLALHRAGRPAEALQAYQEARAILAVELGVEPGPELRHLEERIAFGDVTLGEGRSAEAPTNLPLVPTSFVGREEDVRQVTELVATRPLVTIAGGPGLGKTRLAIEVGHALAATHRDGIRLVRLAEARTIQDVTGAIAAVVGARSQTASFPELAERLAARDMVLVLDNCEHVLGASAAFAREVLARGGAVRILATSRRPLGLADEAVWRIAPLRTPDTEAAGRDGDAGKVLASPAVRLFLDRARATDRTYRLTPESAPQVAALCRRADGVPLALELAAAWVPALGLGEIGDMLSGDQVPPDAGRARGRPGRHRSLHAAMAWSIAMLAPGDRELFEAMSMFRGSFGLEDVVVVCAAEGDRRRMAAGTARLVDASLLVAQRRPSGSVTYRLLTPIREVARERLERRPGWTAIRDRFVGHYLAKHQRPGQDVLRGVVDLGRVDDDLDNLREAFELGLAAGRADDVVRAIVPLDGYFLNRYLAREQRGWLERAVPLVTDAGTRAHGLLSAGFAAQATNDLDGALRLVGAALEAFRALRDDGGTARGLISLAGLLSNRGDWEAGATAAREGRRLVVPHDDPSSLGLAAIYLGTNLAYAGRVAEGVVELEEAAGQFRRSGELGRASHALSTLTFLGVHCDDEPLARRHADDAVDLARRSESTVRLVRALGAQASLEGRWGSAARAARSLVEVDDRMQVQANEVLFELLFPAAFVIRRCERWDLLDAVVQAIGATIEATGQGYPVPWRATAERWSADVTARSPSSGTARTVAPPHSLAEVRSAVRALLEEIARDDGDDAAHGPTSKVRGGIIA